MSWQSEKQNRNEHSPFRCVSWTSWDGNNNLTKTKKHHTKVNPRTQKGNQKHNNNLTHFKTLIKGVTLSSLCEGSEKTVSTACFWKTGDSLLFVFPVSGHGFKHVNQASLWCNFVEHVLQNSRSISSMNHPGFNLIPGKSSNCCWNWSHRNPH